MAGVFIEGKVSAKQLRFMVRAWLAINQCAVAGEAACLDHGIQEHDITFVA
jgi:hypothetical protein